MRWVAPTIYPATTLADHGGVASIAKTRPCHTEQELASPKHAPTERAFHRECEATCRPSACLPRGDFRGLNQAEPSGEQQCCQPRQRKNATYDCQPCRMTAARFGVIL
jgi:hypothetical protein